jgi:hypothetical protein
MNLFAALCGGVAAGCAHKHADASNAIGEMEESRLII